jgi:hypothetical protein
MTVPKPTKETPTTTNPAPEALPALPPKRARRRSTRASHSWRFRKPPSRKRVEAAAARFKPEAVLTPRIAPMTEAQQ